jgi:hypothetical protein
MPTIQTRGAASIKALGFAGASKPLAPTIGTVTRTSASISVPFTAGYNGGAPITGYTVTSTPGNYTFTGSSSPIAATGMTLGTSYTFTVRATNVYGDSPESQTSSSIKYASVPAAPTIGTATVTSKTAVNVTFTAGADGGETITSYTAVSDPGAVTGTINQAGSGTISVGGLTTGTTYRFTVYATNALGNSPSSSPTSLGVTPSLPRYTINTNLLGNVGGDFVDEGATATVSVITNETVIPTTIYWAITGSGVTVSDFTGLSALNGSLAISANSTASFDLNVKADYTTEGTETAVLTFYTNSGRTIALSDSAIGGYVTGTPRNILIQDTSRTPVITSYGWSPGQLRAVGTSNQFDAYVENAIGLSWTLTLTLNGSPNQSFSGTITSSPQDINLSQTFSTAGTYEATVRIGPTGFPSVSSPITITTPVITSYGWSPGGTITVGTSSRYDTYVEGAIGLSYTQTIYLNNNLANSYAGTITSSPQNIGLDYYFSSVGTWSALVRVGPTGFPLSNLTINVEANLPQLNASATVYFPYITYTPNNDTKAYYVRIKKDTSGPAVQYYSLSGNYPPANPNISTSESISPPSGSFSGSITTADVTFYAPHSERYFTVTVTGSGYKAWTQLMYLGNNSYYSPYTVYNGYAQERPDLSASLAAQVVIFYRDYGTFYVTQDPGVPRYHPYRAPEIGGVSFWVTYMTNNAISSTSDQRFLDAFGSAPETFTPKYSYNPGTGYDTFSDRP